MSNEEQSKIIDQLIAKCWADESFKQKLLADTMATLKMEGVALPDGLSIVAVENTDNVFHLVIPAKQTDLSDDDLDKVAGGGARVCADDVESTHTVWTPGSTVTGTARPTS